MTRLRTRPSVILHLNALRELHWTLNDMKKLAVRMYPDGRHRASVFPYGTATGRNAPKKESILLRPVWMRSFWKPAQGMALAYIDWTAAEVGIAAALSGDPVMQEMYRMGDPHLSFAILAGAAPPEATLDTHRAVRDQFKVASLAVLYGQSAYGLAEALECSTAHATQLLATHRRLFKTFWKWSANYVDHVLLGGQAETQCGWTAKRTAFCNERAMMNFPMQANCAELLHLASAYAVEATCLCVARFMMR